MVSASEVIDRVEYKHTSIAKLIFNLKEAKKIAMYLRKVSKKRFKYDIEYRLNSHIRNMERDYPYHRSFTDTVNVNSDVSGLCTRLSTAQDVAKNILNVFSDGDLRQGYAGAMTLRELNNIEYIGGSCDILLSIVQEEEKKKS